MGAENCEIEQNDEDHIDLCASSSTSERRTGRNELFICADTVESEQLLTDEVTKYNQISVEEAR